MERQVSSSAQVKDFCLASWFTDLLSKWFCKCRYLSSVVEEIAAAGGKVKVFQAPLVFIFANQSAQPACGSLFHLQDLQEGFAASASDEEVLAWWVWCGCEVQKVDESSRPRSQFISKFSSPIWNSAGCQSSRRNFASCRADLCWGAALTEQMSWVAMSLYCQHLKLLIEPTRSFTATHQFALRMKSDGCATCWDPWCCEACLKKSNFVKVGTLHPDARGVNVLVKAQPVKCEMWCDRRFTTQISKSKRTWFWYIYIII